MALLCGSAQALTLNSIGSFEQPIYVTSAPNNPDRLFVVERKGRIVEVENGNRTVFADISSLVDPAGEGGLLSVAFAPDFATSGRLYVYYTGKEENPAEIHIAELVASGGTVPLSSRRNMFTFSHPNQTNHYGGQLQFGPEGRLFFATGDGGGEDDEEHNAQDLGSPLGKLLRVNPGTDGVVSDTVDGNPFLSTPGAYPPVWAYGLRNPFRFSFDRVTGALVIGDVGQGKREEVDYAPDLGAGANYGWNCREGLVAGPATDEGCGSGTYTDPIFDYPHSEPSGDLAHGCAIIGGYVARNTNYGDLYGRYIYGDLCVGQIRSLLSALPFASGDRSEGITVDSLNSFGEDSCGRVYAVSGEGPVYRLVGSGGEGCGTQTQQANLKNSFVGIRALRRKVKRNNRALITAFVSPCDGRRGQRIGLWQGKRRIGVRRADRVCSVRFRPRIKHRVRFRAKIASDGVYTEATSRKLKIRILRRHRH